MTRNRLLFKVAVVGLAMPCVLASAPDVRGEKAHEHGAGAELGMMDANGDGKVSESEHAAGAKKMFEMMDGDKDGNVTAAEMDAAHERMMGKAPPKAAGGKTKMSAAEKIKVVDTNHDGVLGADEHAAGSKMMFEKMDTDKNRFLSKAELETGHAKMMSKRASTTAGK